MSELLSTKHPVSKKQYQCDFCYSMIPPHTKYCRSANVYENQFYEWKCHLECEALAHNLDLYDLCDHEEGLSADMFQQYVEVAYCELVPESEYTKDTYEQVKFLLNHMPEAERILWGKNYNFKEE